MSEITEKDVEEEVVNVMSFVLGIVAQCGNTVLLGKALESVVSLSVGVLRGLHDDKYIDGFLTAAINDIDNRIEVEKISVH